MQDAAISGQQGLCLPLSMTHCGSFPVGSRQEIDSAKQQRDWALSERQRIVAERDSMRTMCDTLRRERDDAITKLAVAIRDTDELQRQKEQAERELKKIKSVFLPEFMRNGIIFESHAFFDSQRSSGIGFEAQNDQSGCEPQPQSGFSHRYGHGRMGN